MGRPVAGSLWMRPLGGSACFGGDAGDLQGLGIGPHGMAVLGHNADRAIRFHLVKPLPAGSDLVENGPAEARALDPGQVRVHLAEFPGGFLIGLQMVLGVDPEKTQQNSIAVRARGRVHVRIHVRRRGQAALEVDYLSAGCGPAKGFGV